MLKPPQNFHWFISDFNWKFNLQIYYFYGSDDFKLCESVYSKLYDYNNTYDFLSYYSNHWSGINMYSKYRKVAFLKYPERYHIPFGSFINLIRNIIGILPGTNNRRFKNTYSTIIICSHYHLKDLYNTVSEQTINLVSKNIQFISC